MKKLLLLFIFLFLLSTGKAQNLVNNGSFEEYFECPDRQGELYIDFWFVTPNSEPSSPDYFNTCAPENSEADVPDNISGSQEPYDGNAYVGIFCYGNNSGQREYIYTQLNQPLVANRVYEFSMYVSLADRFQYGINNFGVLFTDHILDGNGQTFIEGNPQIKTTSVITNKDSWTEISGEYTALGGEEFITIGNFFTDENTERISVPPFDLPGWSDYFIDKVSLTEKILDITDLSLENNSKVYPNPFEENISIVLSNKENISNLKIYNAVGETIFILTPNVSRIDVNLKNLSYGIYFLEITDSSLNAITKKIIKR